LPSTSTVSGVAPIAAAMRPISSSVTPDHSQIMPCPRTWIV
jgi:hypothetical protein